MVTLLPNAEEAALRTGCSDPAEAALVLAREHGAVAVTCGRDGALWAANDEVVVRPAQVVTVVDTDGCLTGGLAAAARCVATVGALQ